MKRSFFILLILILALGNSVVFGQREESVDSVYYYYKGEKVFFPLNRTKLIIYPVEQVKVEAIEKNIKGIIEVSKKDFGAYEIIVSNVDYDSVLYALYQSEIVKNVEYVIGDTNSIYVSNIFYVRLKNNSDIELLKKVAKERGATVLRHVLYEWYALEVDKSVALTSLEMSNIFWETGLFADIDSGFMFDSSSNVSCVPETSPMQQAVVVIDNPLLQRRTR